MLPRILKGFAVYVDGRNYIARSESCKLPDLTIKTEEFRGAGMDAPIDHDQGMEKIDVTMTFPEYDPELIKQFGLMTADRQVTLRGAIQRQGEDAVPVVIRLQGGFKSITRDDWQSGQKSNMQIMANCNIYREEIAGETVVDIDILNYKRVIGGVDQLASQRAALGI